MKTISTSAGFQDAKGTVVASGTLMLTLSQTATITATGGQVTTEPIYLPLDVNGKITNTQIIFNDELSPSGTIYYGTVYAVNGCRMIPGLEKLQYSITGASFDLATAVQSSSASPSYSGAVLLTPTGNQTITTGNLTLATGNLALTSGNSSIGGNETVAGTLGVTGAATFSSTINKVTITPPATSATLTIANGKIATVNNSLTLAGVDGTTQTFQASDTIVGRATTDTLSNKTLTGASSGNSTNLLNQQAPTGTLTGTGAAQTVYTYTLPGNTVATGKSLYLRTMFNHNSGTASVTYVLSLNATTLLTFASSTAGSHVIDIDILNTGAATGAVMELFGATSAPAGQTIGSGLAWASNQVLTLTFNVANTDQVTGQGWKLTLDQ